MPKEKMYIEGGGELPDSDKTPNRYLEITWGNGMAYVGIALVTEDDHGKELDRLQVNTPRWDTVNSIIKHMRRARDAAFGRAE